MKKMLLIVTGLSLTLSACLPAFLQQPTANPAPAVDMNATAAVLVQASLEALPSATVPPSNTPVVTTATSTLTPVLVTPTETQNPALLTLTATLGAGTVTATPGTSTATTVGSLPTSTFTPIISFNIVTTPTGTDHPRFYGTQPPALAFGSITLINKSKADVYISLQCTTKDGYTTIIEYPVKTSIEVNAPAGKYLYVAWVGGKQMVGNFGLDKHQQLSIKIYKDHLEIK